MHLATHYAPPTFLKPCLVVDTVFSAKTRETAIKFVEGLNADHSFDIVYRGHQTRHSKQSEWIVIQEHEAREAAIAFHLDLTQHFHNGGTEEEWNEGWAPYLALYGQWCPADMKGGA